MNLNELPDQVSLLSKYNSKKPLFLIDVICCTNCGNKINFSLPTCYNCDSNIVDEMGFNEKDLELFKKKPFVRGFTC